MLLGRVCEIQAVADKKRPSKKSKAQLAVDEAERLIAEAEVEERVAELNGLKVVKPGEPVTDGHEFIKKKLLAHLDLITVGMFTDPQKMKPTTLKLLWDLGKMNEKAEPKSRGEEMTLSKLLLDELKQKGKPGDETRAQA